VVEKRGVAADIGAMTRRKLLALLGVPSLLALIGGAYGARASARNPYYQGPVSDHFDGLRFSDGRVIRKGWSDFFRWQFGGGREAWPATFPAARADKPPARADGLRVSHIGHASFLIQADGVNLITDPLFSERASPVSFAGPKRVNPPGVAFDDLPAIDAILITHNHYDHLDLASIHRIVARDRARIIAPLGNDAIIKAGRPDITVEAHDWGDQVTLAPGVAVTLVPAYHWSARGAFDRHMALWASYVIETAQGRIYHVGDTGYHDGAFFRDHGARFGPFRLALLPIGAYEPRWFMEDNHMNPAEAVQVMLALRAEEAIGHHWGTFQLTNEGVERPRADLAAALAAAGVDPVRFRASLPGMVWAQNEPIG
jgi:L-ascorbate metabolism protein UlaG (beta-lactamase superfamily)